MDDLIGLARDMRKDIIRMINAAGSGHPGGSLSCIDILTALYFGDVLEHFPDDPENDMRDRFILSKGHAAPALYCTLAHAGYFPKEELMSLRKLGSRLQGHPDKKLVPGVEVSTGSLGQGLSIGCGMALALRLKDSHNSVFVLLGDGECQEGQVWEAAMFAAHQKLDNLVAIVDNNGLQIDGAVEDVCNVESISDKFKTFGWDVDAVDGHDMEALTVMLSKAKATRAQHPKLIVARTVKGKGVSFMENQVSWHGKAPNDEQTVSALEELSNVKA